MDICLLNVIEIITIIGRNRWRDWMSKCMYQECNSEATTTIMAAIGFVRDLKEMDGDNDTN